VSHSGGITCTCVWDGVRCLRRASRFYSVREHPYYQALCSQCEKKSHPRGLQREWDREITEDEAVVRSVMEQEAPR
jgi:hypothetical protein